jgi:hypothetical protein
MSQLTTQLQEIQSVNSKLNEEREELLSDNQMLAMRNLEMKQ